LLVVALFQEPGAFHKRAKVVKRDAAIDLQKRTLDDVLKLGPV